MRARASFVTALTFATLITGCSPKGADQSFVPDVPLASVERLRAEAQSSAGACVFIDPTPTERDILAWSNIQNVFTSNRDLYDKYVQGITPGTMLGIVCDVSDAEEVASYARASMRKAGYHGRVYVRTSADTASEFVASE